MLPASDLNGPDARFFLGKLLIRRVTVTLQNCAACGQIIDAPSAMSGCTGQSSECCLGTRPRSSASGLPRRPCARCARCRPPARATTSLTRAVGALTWLLSASSVSAPEVSWRWGLPRRAAATWSEALMERRPVSWRAQPVIATNTSATGLMALVIIDFEIRFTPTAPLEACHRRSRRVPLPPVSTGPGHRPELMLNRVLCRGGDVASDAGRALVDCRASWLWAVDSFVHRSRADLCAGHGKEGRALLDFSVAYRCERCGLVVLSVVGVAKGRQASQSGHGPGDIGRSIEEGGRRASSVGRPPKRA